MTVEGRGGPIYSGLSTDTKPTPIEPTALFVETNTGNFFIWDGAWQQIGAGAALDYKAGQETATDNVDLPVVFNTAFGSTPIVVATFADEQNATDTIEIKSQATTGFTIAIDQGHGGGADTRLVDWIAMEPRDP